VTDKFDLAYAEGHAGGASSMHTHQHKHNVFLVLTGEVLIEGADGEQLAVLRPHMAYTAKVGVPHRMVFLTDATDGSQGSNRECAVSVSNHSTMELISWAMI
jgi:uncharacterized cupin superfamily protein